MPKERYGAVVKAPESSYPVLCAIWEGSVGATHGFLDPADFEMLKGKVPEFFTAVDHLYVYTGPDGNICGYVGVDHAKVEMLFVHPDHLGTGIGSVLFDFAVEVLGANSVDVNEQNSGTLQFYTRKGFRPVARTETDPFGRPYPILTLCREKSSLFER